MKLMFNNILCSILELLSPANFMIVLNYFVIRFLFEVCSLGFVINLSLLLAFLLIFIIVSFGFKINQISVFELFDLS